MFGDVGPALDAMLAIALEDLQKLDPDYESEPLSDESELTNGS